MFTRIELYNNCILTARNTEVFRTKELLEQYLATLDKPYVQDIDLPNVYTRLNGTINLDTTPFNKTFNYIKFTEFDDNNTAKIVCYAFIDSFQIINGLTVIRYTQDIWHTYIGQWELRDSLIINSQWRTSGNVSELPMNPIFNNYHIATSGNKRVSLIAKMQFFKLNTTGEPDPDSMFEGYYLVAYQKQGVGTYAASFNIELTQFSDLLDVIWCDQTRKGTETTLSGWDGANYWVQDRVSQNEIGFYSRIEKFYIVPASWIADSESVIKSGLYFGILTDQKTFRIDQKLKRYGTEQSGYQPTPIYVDEIYFAELVVPSHDIELFSIDVQENAANIAVGFYSSLIKYDFNGHDINYKVLCSVDNDEFALYLEYEGIKTEITDLFEFSQDYEIINAETVAQRSIANKVNTVKGITGVLTNMAQIGVGVATMGAGVPSIPFTTAESPLDAFGIPIPQQMMKSPTQAARGAGGIVGGVAGIVDNVTNIVAANTARYSAFYNANNYTLAIINAALGFVRAYAEWNYVDIPNLETFTKALDEVGYKVAYITHYLDIAANPDAIGIRKRTTDYNVIRFGFVRLTGLSTEICEAISKILTDGVKIWYSINNIE